MKFVVQLSFIFYVSSCFTQAQESPFEWQAEFLGGTFIGKQGDYLYSAYDGNKSCGVCSYNSNTKKSVCKPIEVGKKQEPLCTRMIGGNMFRTFYQIDKGNKLVRVFSSQIDVNSLTSTGETAEILSLPYDRHRGWFEYGNSSNGRFLAILRTPRITNLIGKFKIDRTPFCVSVYDSSVNQVWQYSWEGSRDTSIKVEQFLVADNGIAYMLVLEETGQKFKEAQKVGRKVFRISSQGISVMDLPLATAVEPISLKMAIGNDLGLIITGYVGDGVNHGAASTIFYRYSREGELLGKKWTSVYGIGSSSFIDNRLSFDERRLAQLKQKKGEKWIYSNVIRRISQISPNRILMLSEEDLSASQTEKNIKGETVTTYHHFSRNIHLLMFDSSGTVIWSKKINKLQYNQGYSGFISVLSEDRCLIFYNDLHDNYEENGNRKNYEKLYLVNKPFISKVQVDMRNGEWKRSEIELSEVDEIQLAPRYSVLVDDSTCIVLGVKRKQELGSSSRRKCIIRLE